MTFLENKNKSIVKSFDERMAVRPKGSQKTHNNAITNFDKFCKANYDDKDAETVFSEMILIKDNGMDKIYDVLQRWINYNLNNGMSPSSISMWFSYLKKYIRHLGIKITSDDVKENLDFPKKHEEELHPLQLEEIRSIIEVAHPKKRPLYYALIGSAMRIGEAVQIRKKDLEPEDYLFSVDVRTVQNNFKLVSELLEITLTPHVLRSVFTEKCTIAKISDKYIDAFCGRTSLGIIAKHYTDYSPEKLRLQYNLVEYLLVLG